MAYVLTFAPTVEICVNVVPSLERSTLNPVSLFELSAQDKLIWLDDAAATVRFVGAAGVGVEVEVLIWTIFATEGTPFEFKMNSM